MQEERLSAAYAEAREKRKPARIDDSGNLGRSSNDAFRQIAAVLADSVLSHQNAPMLRGVYSSKAVAASWLLASTCGAPLQTCVLFSSTAALLGGGALVLLV